MDKCTAVKLETTLITKQNCVMRFQQTYVRQLTSVHSDILSLKTGYGAHN